MRRITVVGGLALALCAILALEIHVWGGGLLRIPIPLAGSSGLPVPVLFWTGVFLYTRAYGRLFAVSPGGLRARAIRLGCGLHVLALLGGLMWDLRRGAGVALAQGYVWYSYLVWAATVAGGIVLIRRWAAGCRSVRGDDPSLFDLPLLGGYGFLCAAAPAVPGVVVFAAAAAGLLGGASRVGPEGIRRLARLATRDGLFLALVFFTALALRLFYTVRVMSNPDYLLTGSDGPIYDGLAWALVQGTPVSEVGGGNVALFAPGYVRLVALIYWIFGRSHFAVYAVQSLLGAWACLIAHAIARRLFGTTVARLTAVFAALNFHLIFAAAAMGHQAVDVFWTLAAVWCLVRYVEDPQRWGRRMLGVGLLLGWAAVTREGNLVFWGFLLGWFAVGVRAKLGWRMAARHLALLSLGFLILVVPFVQGSEEGMLGRVKMQWFYFPYSTPHLNQWFNPWQDPAGAWALFREHPLTVLLALGKGMAAQFAAIFLNQDFGYFDMVALLRWSLYSYGVWLYAYVFAFAGFFLVVWEGIRRPLERLGWWLIVVLLVSRALPHLFLEAGYRHRTPFEPFLIMLAAYGLVRVLRPGRPIFAVDKRGRACQDVHQVNIEHVTRMASAP